MAETPPKKLDENGFWLATGKITGAHAQKVVDTAQKIIDRVLKSEVLRKLIDDVKTLVGMVRDYVRGDYRDISWKSVAAAVVALLYVADPIDLVPDIIPIVGQLDDEATLLLAIYLIGDDMRRYRTWRDAREVSTDDPVQRLNS
jgi:uncharacterized membrane protein YkvA (DUF1232 family)